MVIQMTNEDVINELKSLGFTPPSKLFPTKENRFEYVYESKSYSAIWFLASTDSIMYEFKFHDGVFYRFGRPSNTWIPIETMPIATMLVLYK